MANKEDNEKQKPFEIKKGGFHQWLHDTYGKPLDEPITDEDIEKGLNSDDPHVRKMAQFAKNAKKFKHKSSKEKPALESDVTIPAWADWS